MTKRDDLICSICKSVLFLRDNWPTIGTHKDCLDEELKKVKLISFTPHEKYLDEAKTQ